MRLLTDLLATLPQYEASGPVDPSLRISAISNDSRAVREGTLFIAYPGRRVDLHAYLPAAAAAGATAAIVERHDPSLPLLQIVVPDGREAWAYLAAAWEGHPSRDLTVIGVTGTDGKTTTVNLIAAALEGIGLPFGMITTLGARIGGHEIDTGEHVTTPDAPVIQKLLRQMVDEGARVALLETTSHALAQHRVTAVDFDIAVVTNITHEHLDEHGSLQNYRAAKRRLFELLTIPRPAGGRPRVAVLNADDSSFPLLAAVPVERQLRYGIETAEAEVRATEIAFRPGGSHFVAQTPTGAIEIQTHLLGRFNVYNTLAALAVGLALEGEPAAIARGIRALERVTGRMEAIDEGQPFQAIVDFAHTPVSLEAALHTAREMSRGRVIVVFGSAGERDRAKRGMMGEIAGRLADLAVITAEDPRTEDVVAICAEIAAGAARAGAVEGSGYVVIPDRAAAIFHAVAVAGPGDLVIACGKGHEPSMCFGTTETPWSEHEVLRAALRALPSTPGAAPPPPGSSRGEGLK